MAGSVTTLAGSSAGFADGMGSNAQFKNPYAVAVDVLDMVYVADSSNYRIRLVTSSGEEIKIQYILSHRYCSDSCGIVCVWIGMVSTLAGSVSGWVDGIGTAASFQNPNAITVDSNLNIYVADYIRVRWITREGI